MDARRHSTPKATMEVSDIGKYSDIPSLHAYCSQGLILDLHLTRKLSWEDAVSWAKEMHAEHVLKLLQSTYRPPMTSPRPVL